MKRDLTILLASSLSILSKPMAFLIFSVLKHSIYQCSFATGSTSLSHTESVSMETSGCLRKYLATKDWRREGTLFSVIFFTHSIQQLVTFWLIFLLLLMHP